MNMVKFENDIAAYVKNTHILADWIEEYKRARSDLEKLNRKTEILCQIAIVKLCEERVISDVNDELGSLSTWILDEEKANMGINEES